MNFENKKPIIFIICGKARSGKTTITKYIKEYYENKNLKTIDIMYAETIKNYTKKITGWDGNDETKPRTFLQQLGTELIRNKIDSNLFTRRMLEDINVYSYFYDIITISDARFIDELELPKKHFENVILIKIERPDLISDLTISEQTHISENALNEFNDYDYIIKNNSTLDELKMKIYKILDEVK